MFHNVFFCEIAVTVFTSISFLAWSTINPLRVFVYKIKEFCRHLNNQNENLINSDSRLHYFGFYGGPPMYFFS